MAASVSPGEKHFVDQYWEKLIQQITMVHPVLDHLLQEDLLTHEQYDIVKAENTSQEKMRRLLTYTRGWNTSDKDTLLRALKTSNPAGTKNLGGTSLLEKPKTGSDGQIKDLRMKYMMSTRQRYQRFKAHNSCRGKYVSLDKIYTQILLIKDNQHKQEREHEIQYLGRRHLQLLNDRSSGEHSPTTVQALFYPDEDGITPKTVVLEGPAGIGKTMTCQKIMLDWASGNLYKDKFCLLFYLSCRELNNVNGCISLARLLSRICRLPDKEVLKVVLGDSENLLFIIDGLDELRWSLEDQSEFYEDPFQETHLKVILRSLLKKEVLSEASLIITTRSFVLEKLDELLEDPRYVEALGFTGKEREKYVYKFFKDKDVAEKVLGIIKENDIVFTMCAIPIMCWIVCTVMEQEIKKDLDLIQCRTTTSIYILYLKGLIKYHSRKQPVVTCLGKVCALANEGVFSRKIIFEESDLRRHGLSMTEMESVFLNESIIHQDIEISTCYSFIHLTVQEFFAALYYVLGEEPSNGKGTPLADFLSQPDNYFGKSMTEMCINKPHLPLMVQFLYGLTDNNQGKELSKITGCDISFRATPAMKSWLACDNLCFYNELICSLYEMQDEDFVRTLMSRTRGLKFRLLGKINCIRQLAYCLKTRKEIHKISFRCWKMGLEDFQILSPFLQTCSVLQFTCYEKDSLSCEGLHSLIVTHRSLKKLIIFSTCLRDSDVTLLCEGLRHPDCTLQEFRFTCSLTQATCNDLHELIRSRPETKLDVMFYVEEEMPLPDVHRLFESLRLPGCTWNDSLVNIRGTINECIGLEYTPTRTT